MPKYLLVGSYTDAGLKGLLREGGSKRREAAIELAESVGGTLEALYFALAITTSTRLWICRTM